MKKKAKKSQKNRELSIISRKDFISIKIMELTEEIPKTVKTFYIKGRLGGAVG